MMIRISVGTNLSRTDVVTENTKSIRQVLQEQDINYATSTVYLDGVSLALGDMDKTFAELGINESCMLISCTKTENA